MEGLVDGGRVGGINVEIAQAVGSRVRSLGMKSLAPLVRLVMN